MKTLFTIVFSLVITLSSFTQTKTIHVFVALCDNENQGIVPVPAKLGNGKDAKNNLYYGAMYGVKSYLRYKTKGWIYIKTIKPKNKNIIERVLFKHKTKDVYLLADAYDGAKIKTCTIDFLKAANYQNPQIVLNNNKTLKFGGNSNLVAYIGHDGLMEFDVNVKYNKVAKPKDIIILACSSKVYFTEEVKKANANPLLWTNHLMAPEAYTLKAAIDGWLLGESGKAIKERGAQAYHKYQKCGIRGARNLFATGF